MRIENNFIEWYGNCKFLFILSYGKIVLYWLLGRVVWIFRLFRYFVFIFLELYNYGDFIYLYVIKELKLYVCWAYYLIYIFISKFFDSKYK